jgi:hypothetical protein
MDAVIEITQHGASVTYVTRRAIQKLAAFSGFVPTNALAALICFLLPIRENGRTQADNPSESGYRCPSW